MKIIDRKTFLALPAGVLFSKYRPCHFDSLQIKGGTIGGIDFAFQEIAGAIACTGGEDFVNQCVFAEQGRSVAMDLDCQGRDGCFDEDQLFAVWEAEDIQQLLVCLAKVVPA